MLRKLRAFLAHTWVFVRHHDWTREPQSQRRMRERVAAQIHAMQYDPYVQWKYHLRMSWFWVANIIPTGILLYFETLGPVNLRDDFLGIMVGLNTYYSLYANFDTEFSGVHAAWAALRGDQIAQKSDVLEAEHFIVEEIRGDGHEESLETLHKLYLESLEKLARIEAALQRRSYRGKKNGENGGQDHAS